jgi:hypothetical protein
MHFHVPRQSQNAMQNHRLKSDMEMNLKVVITVAKGKAMLQVT